MHYNTYNKNDPLHNIRTMHDHMQNMHNDMHDTYYYISINKVLNIEHMHNMHNLDNNIHNLHNMHNHIHNMQNM